MKLFKGNIVFSKSLDALFEYKNSYIAVEDGVVKGIFKELPNEYRDVEVEDFGDDVIIPAFSDLHVHAPQYPNRGLQMDEILSDWLSLHTFPLEAKFKDMDYARKVYDAFVDDMIEHGTMHASVFATIHSEATGYLVERLEARRIRSFVGKVNMDVNSPKYLCETVENSLRDTREFLDKYSKNRYSKPIITPRFAPTCSDNLLKGLGKLAEKYQVGVQTHVVESKWEAEEAKRLFPSCSCDTEIYEKAGLLGHGQFIAAHFMYPSVDDVRILKKYDGVAVQCPDATISIIAGIMPTKRLQDEGVKVALGTDLSAGHSLGVYSQAGRAVQLSKIKGLYEPENSGAISFARAFYMATKQGGEVFGNVGSFENGYSFDALVIGGIQKDFEDLTPLEKVERFCYLGETKHIKHRFMAGEKIG